MGNLSFEDCQWLDLELELPTSPSLPDSTETVRVEALTAAFDERRAS